MAGRLGQVISQLCPPGIAVAAFPGPSVYRLVGDGDLRALLWQLISCVFD